MSDPKAPPKSSSPIRERPSQALDSFLEDLLAPVEEYRPASVLTPERKPAPPVEAPSPVLSTPVVVEPEPELQEVVSPVSAISIEETDSQTPYPGFAQQAFQCLMFSAGGKDYAVPLVSLNGIVEWRDQASKLPGQPDWHQGVMTFREGKMSVVNLTELLMPGQSAHTDHYRYILAIADGRFGLLCEMLHDTVKLNKEDIQWRRHRQQRPWLLGTHTKALCPLIDVDVIANMLADGR